MTRILGIDPGSIITGYGIIEMQGTQGRYVASGHLKIRGETLPERLKQIFEDLTVVVQEHAPTEMAIEKVFMNSNADSALKLGQARGAAITACVMQDLPVSEYTPAQIKQSVAGSGRADKIQIQHMVNALLNLKQAPQADEADALAVALCHGHSAGTLTRLSVPVRGRSRGRWR
jgi:crossover junction endodeoxyribonuclease RuvC